MKQHIWVGVMMVIMGVHASDNPFELQENFKELEESQKSLLSDLKKIAKTSSSSSSRVQSVSSTVTKNIVSTVAEKKAIEMQEAEAILIQKEVEAYDKQYAKNFRKKIKVVSQKKNNSRYAHLENAKIIKSIDSSEKLKKNIEIKKLTVLSRVTRQIKSVYPKTVSISSHKIIKPRVKASLDEEYRKAIREMGATSWKANDDEVIDSKPIVSASGNHLLYNKSEFDEPTDTAYRNAIREVN